MQETLNISEIQEDTGITIASLNICSGFNKKMPDIQNTLDSENIDLLFLQEVEIKDIDKNEPPRFEKYTTVCPKKDTKNKTRILMLIRENIKIKIREDLMSKEISSIWVELQTQNGTKTIIGSLYREFDDLTEGHSSNSLSEQNKRFDLFLDQLSKANEERGTILCLGDINLDANK